MNEEHLLANGLVLLGMGIGFVMCFLTVTIFSMHVLAKVVGYLNKLFPEAVEEVKTTAQKAVANVDEAIAVALAAIAAKRS